MKVLTMIGTILVSTAIAASFVWQMLMGFCPVP
jgi:hypothetical protein